MLAKNDFTGLEVRAARIAAGVSQARLAELTKISQPLLSSFELGKRGLSQRQLETVQHILANLHKFKDVVNRKKRYQQHSYQRDLKGHDRSGLCQRTVENFRYLDELKSMSLRKAPKLSAISLFAGIGGLSLGFHNSGFDVKSFVEIDDSLASIYSENFHTAVRLGSDLTQLRNESVESELKRVGDIDCVIGGPPCQGFSLAGKRDIADPRNYLFKEYIRFISIVRPKIAIMENVRLLTSMKSNNGSFIKDDVVRAFQKAGYRSEIYEINAMDYGVPQHRERVIFMAIRNDLLLNPSLPRKNREAAANLFSDLPPPRTFADACSDLVYLESGEASPDPFHVAVRHPNHVLEWLWDVPQGASAHDNLDPNLRPPSGYNTTYKRQVWSEPGATVQTTFGMISACRSVHPIATRSLTIREAARLQSFPDSFRLIGTLGSIRTGIGNAVPPLLARSLAKHVFALLSDFVEVPSFQIEL